MELPGVLRKITNDSRLNIKSLQLTLKNAILPAVAIPNVEMGFQGQTYNVSSLSRPNYSPLEVSFMVDNAFNNYYTIWKWLDILNTSDTSIYGGSPDSERYKELEATLEYQSNLQLQLLDEYNNKIASFLYTDAFPTTLGAIPLDYQTPGQISTSCSFQFNKLLML